MARRKYTRRNKVSSSMMETPYTKPEKQVFYTNRVNGKTYKISHETETEVTLYRGRKAIKLSKNKLHNFIKHE